MSNPKTSSFDVRDVTIKDITSDKSTEDKYDAGIVGVPYDGATRGRPGARFAPMEVRKRLSTYKAYCVDYDVDLSNLRIVDFGDIEVGFGDINIVRKNIIANLKQYLSKSSITVILGGDHSITFPSFKAARDVFDGEWGLVVIDAHHDLRELEEGRVSSGTVINDIIRDKLIEPKKIIQVGIRGFANSPYYAKKAKELGIKIFLSNEVKAFGGKRVAKDILLNLLDDVDNIYFSFDVDGVDIAFAPGVNSPSSGGILPHDLFEFIFYLLKDDRVRVMDVVEFAPPFDTGGITRDLVANAVLYALSGYVVRGEG